MDPECVLERVVSLCVGPVDFLPRRQHEHWIDKLECFSLGLHWLPGLPQCVKQHGMGLDGRSLEEYEAIRSRDLSILCKVAPVDLPRKFD